jgi:hypothetical protein
MYSTVNSIFQLSIQINYNWICEGLLLFPIVSKFSIEKCIKVAGFCHFILYLWSCRNKTWYCTRNMNCLYDVITQSLSKILIVINKHLCDWRAEGQRLCSLLVPINWILFSVFLYRLLHKYIEHTDTGIQIMHSEKQLLSYLPINNSLYM